MMQCECRDPRDQHLVHDHRSGDTVCTSCARVVEAHAFDLGPEWFGDTNARASAPGKYAMLDEFPGTKLDIKKRYADPDPHKSTRLGLAEIDRLSGYLGLGSDHQMCTSAKTIYSDYAMARTAGGRTIRYTERTVAAACALYFGCKSYERRGCSRSIKEISGVCGVHATECTRMIKSFKSLLAKKPYGKVLFSTVTPEDILVRAMERMEFPLALKKNAIRKRASSMFETIRERDMFEGRMPETVCCAVLYRCCELEGTKITKKCVYQACGTTAVNLNNMLLELHDL